MSNEVIGNLVKFAYVLNDGRRDVLDRIGRDPAFGINCMLSAVQEAIEIEKNETPPFVCVSALHLDAVPAKPNSECFSGWERRSPMLDNWFFRHQPETPACEAFAARLLRKLSSREVAAAVLGIGADTDGRALGKLLIKCGHTITKAQAEELYDRTMRGENTGLCFDEGELSTFYFTETGDPENPVVVGDMSLDHGIRTRVRCSQVYRFSSYRLYDGTSFILRNMRDASV